MSKSKQKLINYLNKISPNTLQKKPSKISTTSSNTLSQLFETQQFASILDLKSAFKDSELSARKETFNTFRKKDQANINDSQNSNKSFFWELKRNTNIKNYLLLKSLHDKSFTPLKKKGMMFINELWSDGVYRKIVNNSDLKPKVDYIKLNQKIKLFNEKMKEMSCKSNLGKTFFANIPRNKSENQHEPLKKHNGVERKKFLLKNKELSLQVNLAEKAKDNLGNPMSCSLFKKDNEAQNKKKYQKQEKFPLKPSQKNYFKKLDGEENFDPENLSLKIEEFNNLQSYTKPNENPNIDNEAKTLIGEKLASTSVEDHHTLELLRVFRNRVMTKIKAKRFSRTDKNKTQSSVASHSPNRRTSILDVSVNSIKSKKESKQLTQNPLKSQFTSYLVKKTEDFKEKTQELIKECDTEERENRTLKMLIPYFF